MTRVGANPFGFNRNRPATSETWFSAKPQVEFAGILKESDPRPIFDRGCYERGLQPLERLKLGLFNLFQSQPRKWILWIGHTKVGRGIGWPPEYGSEAGSTTGLSNPFTVVTAGRDRHFLFERINQYVRQN